MYRFIVAILLTAGILGAQDETAPQLPVSDPICSFFDSNMASRSRLLRTGGNAVKLSRETRAVAAQLAPPPGGGRTSGANNLSNSSNMIDQYLFTAMQSAGVQPADTTTDWEFVRRVYLDLTGRIPSPTAVLTFVNGTSATKRSDLVEQLLASTEYVDKWTMYFGDLYKNVSQNAQITTYPASVLAFYTYIKQSVATDKPYDQMAREIISATGPNSYDVTNGQMNFTVNGVVTGGPAQDIYDQQVANVADVFLGISHLNCLLCHNGQGHLTGLSLWGQQQTRYNAWGMAAFLSHTNTTSAAVSTTNSNRYWIVADTGTKNYQLNTLTGNRPARQPIGTVTTVPPTYILSGAQPAAGQNYRQALATMITGDPQFARATVNYFWAYFYGAGLVDPPDTFDPDRLDPDNPPAAATGYTLQPSNPRLLNALATQFIANKYDLKWLMRQIVNSQSYQLSAQYDGQWNDAWANLFARKNVRRLWAEELHDAITVSSQYVPTYTTMATYGPISYAMQFPEPLNTPDGANGHVDGWLNSFLRGNRDDQTRSQNGSILQALNLMNDSFVMTRTATGSPAGALLPGLIGQSNMALVNGLFLNVLSRYPTPTELSQALQDLSNPLTRNQQAQNLLWTLYNKVDFVFNY